MRVNRIVVSHLGKPSDLLCCAGLLAALHRHWPRARIGLLLRRHLAALQPLLPLDLDVRALAFDPRRDDPSRQNRAQRSGALRSAAEWIGDCDLLILAGDRSDTLSTQIARRARPGLVLEGGPRAPTRSPASPVAKDAAATASGAAPAAGAWLVLATSPRADAYTRCVALAAALGIEHCTATVRLPDDAAARACRWIAAQGASQSVSAYFCGALAVTASSERSELAATALQSAPLDWAAVVLRGSASVADECRSTSDGSPRIPQRRCIPAPAFSDDPLLLTCLLSASRAYIGWNGPAAHAAAILGIPTIVVDATGRTASCDLPRGRVVVVKMPALRGCQSPSEAAELTRALHDAWQRALASSSDPTRPPLVIQSFPESEFDRSRRLAQAERAARRTTQAAERLGRRVRELQSRLPREALALHAGQIEALLHENHERIQGLARLTERLGSLEELAQRLASENHLRIAAQQAFDARLAQLAADQQRPAASPSGPCRA